MVDLGAELRRFQTVEIAKNTPELLALTITDDRDPIRVIGLKINPSTGHFIATYLEAPRKCQ